MRFIAAHADRRSADGLRWGVEPICTVLSGHGVKIAPSTYYATLTRVASARAVRDAVLLPEIVRVHSATELGRGLYGVRKVWHQLKREGFVVPRCQVARLMSAGGMQGVRRGAPFVTTKPDPGANRAPDLVDRDFTATRPNALWVVDFTYVPTWSGMAFTAFVSDVYSRRIVGWRTAASMPTELPLDALEMALWTRARSRSRPSRCHRSHRPTRSRPARRHRAAGWHTGSRCTETRRRCDGPPRLRAARIGLGSTAPSPRRLAAVQ